jgi:hypothetical protein
MWLVLLIAMVARRCGLVPLYMAVGGAVCLGEKAGRASQSSTWSGGKERNFLSG